MDYDTFIIRRMTPSEEYSVRARHIRECMLSMIEDIKSNLKVLMAGLSMSWLVVLNGATYETRSCCAFKKRFEYNTLYELCCNMQNRIQNMSDDEISSKDFVCNMIDVYNAGLSI
jgi:hypothetical protein